MQRFYGAVNKQRDRSPSFGPAAKNKPKVQIKVGSCDCLRERNEGGEKYLREKPLRSSESSWKESETDRFKLYSCAAPFMCIMPSDGGPRRPEGPRGPRAVQTADP